MTVREVAEELVEEVEGPEKTETYACPAHCSPAGRDPHGAVLPLVRRRCRGHGRGVFDEMDPEVRWLKAADGTRTAPDMEDRAAKYVSGGNLILINADFRGFAGPEDVVVGGRSAGYERSLR